MSRQPRSLQEDTVEALVENVRHFLDAEDKRSQSFTARGSGLAGFIGIIVSISAVVGRELFRHRWEHAVTEGIGLVGFAVAVTLLVGSLVVAVVGVLWPRSFDTISIEEIERYPLPEFVYERRVMVQGRTLRGLVEALASERSRNAAKARPLKWSYGLLLAAIVGMAATGLTLGLDEAFLEE